MLDHHHGVALVTQSLQHPEQLRHIVEMQPGGGLIEHIQRTPGGALGELAREFDALRFAAGEGGRVLSEFQVTESDID